MNASLSNIREMASLREIPFDNIIGDPQENGFFSIDVGHPGQAMMEMFVDRGGTVFYVRDYCCWGTRQAFPVLL